MPIMGYNGVMSDFQEKLKEFKSRLEDDIADLVEEIFEPDEEPEVIEKRAAGWQPEPATRDWDVDFWGRRTNW